VLAGREDDSRSCASATTARAFQRPCCSRIFDLFHAGRGRARLARRARDRAVALALAGRDPRRLGRGAERRHRQGAARSRCGCRRGRRMSRCPRRRAPRQAPGPAPKRRVLVADDNRDGAASLGLLLTLAGHEAHFAHDGLEALEVAERMCGPDYVAACGLGMPAPDGLEAARTHTREPAVGTLGRSPWSRDGLGAGGRLGGGPKDAGFDQPTTGQADRLPTLSRLLAPDALSRATGPRRRGRSPPRVEAARPRQRPAARPAYDAPAQHASSGVHTPVVLVDHPGG
jgi:hypothetical protein